MRTTTIYLLFTLTICLFSLSANAQISSGGIPYSKQYPQHLETPIPPIKLSTINEQALLAEDELSTSKSEGYRFAIPIPVSIHLTNSGIWETLPNGDRIWRVHLYSTSAKNLYLEYDLFYLPKGSTLHLYNADQSICLGAFTESNNKASRQFATGMIAGATTILEYYEPQSVQGEGKIHISRVFHGYRSFQDVAKDFGDAGSCNNNVHCPEWAAWEEPINAVVLIIANGRRACTGTMINTTQADCVPYLLTANHCNLGNVAQNIFIFNYQSATCANVEASLQQSIVGATVIANNKDSDFELLLLSRPPPPDYKAFYTGWNRSETIDGPTVTIHHPRGDVKKISLNAQNPVPTAPTEPVPAHHWLISEWENGTTEPTSSGAPLFNHGLLVGQLFGGIASCDSIGFDAFGRLDYSWDKGQESGRRLRNWLDPANTQLMIMDGQYCTSSPALVDLALLSVIQPDALQCRPQSFVPEIAVYNNGLETIRELMVVVTEPPLSTNWTGELLAGESRVIPLEGMGRVSFAGPYVLAVEVSTVAPQVEVIDHLANNKLAYQFEVLNVNELHIQLITDNFGNETTLEITNESGNRFIEAGPFNDQDTISLTYCLENGSYQFTIFDKEGDGICCAFGNGGYQVWINDTILVGQGSEFGAIESVAFTITDTIVGFAPIRLPLNENNFNIKLYPNPIQNELWVNHEDEQHPTASLKIYNLQGQTLFQTNLTMGLQSIPFRKKIRQRNESTTVGVYIAVIQSGNTHQAHKLLLLPD